MVHVWYSENNFVELILSFQFVCFWGLNTCCQACCPSNFTSWPVSCRPLKTKVWWFTSAILVLGSWAKRTAALSRLASSADWDHLSLPLLSQNENWSYPQFWGRVCFRHGVCSLTEALSAICCFRSTPSAILLPVLRTYWLVVTSSCGYAFRVWDMKARKRW